MHEDKALKGLCNCLKKCLQLPHRDSTFKSRNLSMKNIQWWKYSNDICELVKYFWNFYNRFKDTYVTKCSWNGMQGVCILIKSFSRDTISPSDFMPELSFIADLHVKWMKSCCVQLNLWGVSKMFTTFPNAHLFLCSLQHFPTIYLKITNLINFIPGSGLHYHYGANSGLLMLNLETTICWSIWFQM